MCASGSDRLSGLTPGHGTQRDAFGSGWNTLALSHLSHVVGRVSHAGSAGPCVTRGSGEQYLLPFSSDTRLWVQVPFCGRGEHAGLRPHPGLLVWGGHACASAGLLSPSQGLPSRTSGPSGKMRTAAIPWLSLPHLPGATAGAYGLRKSVKQAFAAQSPGHVPLFPPRDLQPARLLRPRDAPHKAGVGRHVPLLGLVPARDQNPVSCLGLRRSLTQGPPRPQAKTLRAGIAEGPRVRPSQL